MNHEVSFSFLRLGYVDDKNCLAQLTVVQKINHCRYAFLSGFYPELVEGFFAQAKERTLRKKKNS